MDRSNIDKIAQSLSKYLSSAKSFIKGVAVCSYFKKNRTRGYVHIEPFFS